MKGAPTAGKDSEASADDRSERGGEGGPRWSRRGADHAWLFVGGLIAVMVTGTLVAAGTGFMDFAVYHAAAVRVLDGTGIYANPEGTRPFTYPPAAAYLLSPLGLLEELTAGHVFSFVSLVALGRAAYLLTRSALPDLVGRARVLTAAAVPAALLAAEPSVFTIAFGQVNFILLWLVCEDALGSPRLPRGFLTGVAAAVKLTPLVFAGAWVVAGRWAMAVWAGVAFLGAAAVGFVVDPAASATFWTDLVRNVERVGVVQYAHNQSINGTLWRVLGKGGSAPLWFGLSVATGLVALATARSLARRGDDLGCVAVMGVAMTLVSPIAWGHHWVWAYPAVLWLVGSLWSSRPHPWLLLAAVPVFWGRLVHLMPQNNDVELTGPLLVRVLQSPYAYWGLAFVFTVAVGEWVRARGRPVRVRAADARI